MSVNELIAMVEQQLRDYAVARAKVVARGLETPHLAALLVRKYGQGVLDTVATLLGPQYTETLGAVLDREVKAIDAEWQEHDLSRWAMRPAEVQELQREA